jgi:hypothetical protein
LDSSKIDEAVAIHMITVEEKVRLDPNTQELYKIFRQHQISDDINGCDTLCGGFILLEDIMQAVILSWHGVKTVIIDHPRLSKPPFLLLISFLSCVIGCRGDHPIAEFGIVSRSHD